MSEKVYIFAIATIKEKQEAFNLLVTPEQKERALADVSFRESLASRARAKIEEVLKIKCGARWRFYVMPPTGQEYERYLRILKTLKPEVIEGTTVDLTIDLN